MPVLDARRVVEPLVGTTILTPSQAARNDVVEIRGGNVIVRTEDSGHAGAPVALTKIQQALDMLFERGEVAVTPDTFGGYRRSSFIGAVLLTLDAVEADTATSPTVVRLPSESPLSDQLSRACALVTQPREGTGRVVTHDPLYQLLVHELKATLAGIVTDPGYKVRGSVGQPNFTWATTPWVAVFDRLVTESAQRGHYTVFLVNSTGSGGYLSLMQGVTESSGAGSEARLRARAETLRSLLAPADLEGLDTSPLQLSGGGWRTDGYNAGNVAAVRFDATALRHDAALIFHLRRLLRLANKVTASSDALEALATGELPEDARTGSEARRYRWHLRAEGRNRSVVDSAKRLHGYVCVVCGRDFVDELGELGKRCIDAHHLIPFAEMDERPKHIDPATDFAIVCANCHRLLHSETPPLSPDALRALMGLPHVTKAQRAT